MKIHGPTHRIFQRTILQHMGDDAAELVSTSLDASLLKESETVRRWDDAAEAQREARSAPGAKSPGSVARDDVAGVQVGLGAKHALTENFSLSG